MITDDPVAQQSQPAWLRFAPFLRDPPALSARQWSVFTQVALAMAVATYTAALLTLALPQIQVDLGIATAELSSLLAIIRLGALGSFLFSLAADQLGRRRMMIAATGAVALLAFATALAPTVASFVVLQCLARAVAATVALLAGVFIVEEFPDGARGWGVGALTALASFGGGTAAVLFSLVDTLPFGWRALMALGGVAFFVALRMGRHLPETLRFASGQARRSAPGQLPLWTLLLQLIRTYPLRFAGLAGLIILFNLGGDAALIYDATYLQQRHSWQPWQISLLNLCAGFMALIGSTLAGQLGDHFGRKRTLVFFLCGFSLFVMTYYNAFGWLLPLFWAGLLFASIGATVVVSTVSSELFPTAYRSTASGVIAAIATLFGALSLVVHGWLLPVVASPWVAVSVLAGLVLLAPLCVALLPETSGRALEEIAAE